MTQVIQALTYVALFTSLVALFLADGVTEAQAVRTAANIIAICTEVHQEATAC